MTDATPTYQRDPATQQAFEAAAASLLENDAWTDPNGQRQLNADLVLEGGGVKGIGLAGAILTLAEAGYRFPRVAGTSAGAIAATLVAAIGQANEGMTKLKDYLGQLQFAQFMVEGHIRHWADKILGQKVTDAGDLMMHMGLYSGDYLGEWLRPILTALGVTTFGDLRITQAADPGMSLPEEHQYRVVVHASDITRGELVRLPWDYDYYGLDRDSQDIVGAVRASMSIPFFFEPVRVLAQDASVKVRNPDGTYADQDYPGGQVTWVDGGMLANFPINAFDREDGGPARWPTIGIKLSAQPLEMAKDVACNDTCAEAMRCLHTMLNEWDRYHVDQTTADRTIFVDNGSITATQFNLTTDQQQMLFLNGAQAATNFVIAKARAGGVPRGPKSVVN
jgi:NTE family protein